MLLITRPGELPVTCGASVALMKTVSRFPRLKMPKTKKWLKKFKPT
jgi:hypothetical protein